MILLVIMLSLLMRSAVRLNVVLLNVAAPSKPSEDGQSVKEEKSISFDF